MSDSDGQLSLFDDAVVAEPGTATADVTHAKSGPAEAATTAPEPERADTRPPAPPLVVEEPPAADDDTAHTDAAPARPTLPASSAADDHAVIITDSGSYLPSGQRLSGPVDDIDKLAKLLDWLFARKRLQPKGSAPQVWLIGQTVHEQLGWWVEPPEIEAPRDQRAKVLEQTRAMVLEQLAHQVLESLSSMLVNGWEVRGEPGHRIHLTRTMGRGRRMVDLVLEPYAWTISMGAKDFGILGDGEDLPDDDMAVAAEIGRRIGWSVEHLGVLPGPTATRTAADIVDQITRARRNDGPGRKKGKSGSESKSRGAVVDTAGPIPVLGGQLHGELEPRVRWARTVDSDDIAGVDRIVTVDQRASYLASAGMLSLGWGEPVYIAAGVEKHARSDKMPFGLWRVTLPAADSLSLPPKLPLPHPHMQRTTPVSTWVTSVSLEGLTAPIADGGAGLDVDDLEIDEAWLWPEQGRALEAWATRLRKARAVAVETGDTVMKRHVGDIYKRYVGRMLNPEQWQAASKQHHHQPVWRAAIMASSRWRSRRAAMRLAEQTGRWPIHAFVDSLTYLAGEGEQISDPSPYLGKLVFEKGVGLTSDQIDAFTAATDPNALYKVIETVLGRDDEGETQ